MNDFLYFVIKPYGAPNTIFYCSGVNVTRFSPLTMGKHGQGSNPAVRGLQLIRIGVMDMALKIGGKAKRFSGQECKGIAPTADSWYTEGLIIEHVTEAFSKEALEYSVTNLIKKIGNALRLKDKMPGKLLPSHELQRFIEELCVKYSS